MITTVHTSGLSIRFDVPLGAGASRGVRLAKLARRKFDDCHCLCVHTDGRRQRDKANQPGLGTNL
jgi:hypothetical protein